MHDRLLHVILFILNHLFASITIWFPCFFGVASIVRGVQLSEWRAGNTFSPVKSKMCFRNESAKLSPSSGRSSER